MIPGICDDPDRLAARFYLRLRVDCGCCTSYRFLLVGVLLGAAITAAVLVPLLA